MDLDELIKKWETSALEFGEAERFITLLISENRKLKHRATRPAPCHNFCESNAYEREIAKLRKQLNESKQGTRKQRGDL